MATKQLSYTAAQIDAAIAKVNSLIIHISGAIVQLYDGSTAIYPRTKAEAVFFDNDLSKTLDQQFSQLEQERININSTFGDAKDFSSIENGYIDSINGRFVPYDSGTHKVAFYNLDNQKNSLLYFKVGGNVTFGAKYYSYYDNDMNSFGVLHYTSSSINFILPPVGATKIGILVKFPDGNGDESDFNIEEAKFKIDDIDNNISKFLFDSNLGKEVFTENIILNGYIDSVSGNFVSYESYKTKFFRLSQFNNNDILYLQSNTINDAKYYAFYKFDSQTGQPVTTCIDGCHIYKNGINYIKKPIEEDIFIGVIFYHNFNGSGGREEDISLKVIENLNIDFNEIENSSNIVIKNGYINSINGNFSSYGEGTHKVNFYPILENSIYEIIASNVNSDNFANYYGFFENINTTSSVDGITHHFKTIGRTIINPPKKAKYVGIITRFANIDANIELIKVKKENFINSAFHNEKIKNILEIKNGYVDSINGNFSSYGEGTHQTCFYLLENVKWKSNIILKVSNNVTFGAKYYSFYGLNGITSITGKLDYVNGDNYIEVPEGAKYFAIISKFPDGNGDESDFVVLYDNGGIIKQSQDILDWSNKTWCVVGDSLTEKNYRAVKNYFDYISEITGINIINKGKSGQGYASGLWFTQAITQAQNYDFLTIFGSGNDIRYTIISNLQWASTWEEALGTSDSHGNSTIGGCMNDAIDNFYTKTPHKPLGIITPTPWKNGTYIEQLTDAETHRRLDMYSNLLVEICNKRGIPCLDLFHCSGLQPTIESFRLEFYKEESLQDEGVHPNSKGHKWLFPIFFEFVRKYLIM